MASAPTARPTLPHRFALDGLRGLAVIGVVLYHLDLPWMPGGFLGVSLFFTLSGFLITNLVLVERDQSSRIDLREFWARRFRRLLPASLLAIAMAVAFGWFAATSDQLSDLRGDVTGALGYVANWRFILNGDVYGAGYQEPSPLQHFWSLAIEEQFYVLFPLLAWALTRRGASRRMWGGVVGALMVGSMLATLVLYDAGDPSRVYYGTDTRAFELLAGVALALAVRMAPPDWLSKATSGRWSGPLLLTLPAVATLWLWTQVHQTDAWLYRGGLWVVALVSCGLILVALEHGSMSRVFSLRPLCWIGVISYGIYLFHWPIIRWVTSESTGLEGVALASLRVALTLAVALASYHLVEQPIRQRRMQLPAPALVVGIPVLVVIMIGGSHLAAGRADDRAVDTEAAEGVQLQPSAVAERSRSAATPTTALLRPVERVLFMGDSLVHQSMPGLQEAFAAEGIEVRAVGAPGQTLLGNRAEWLAQLEEAVAEFDPDAVVMEGCCGFGDPRKDSSYTAPDGRVLELDTPELYAEWADVAREATTIASRRGAIPLWVLAPPAQTNGYYGPIEPRIAKVNEIYLALAECSEQVGLVDWRVLTGPDGQYAAELPGADGAMVPVRSVDGLHFTPAGVGVIAGVTIDAIESGWAAEGGRLDPPAVADVCTASSPG